MSKEQHRTRELKKPKAKKAATTPATARSFIPPREPTRPESGGNKAGKGSGA